MNLVKRFAAAFYISISLIAAGSIYMPAVAHAQVDPQCYKTFLGFPPWYRYLRVEYIDAERGCEITGPVNASDPNPARRDRVSLLKAAPLVGLAVLDILLRLAGVVAFVFLIASGFRFVLSQGDPQKEKDARETAINAIIGMVISIFAIAVIGIIGRRLIIP